MRDKKLNIIVPCFNEEEALPETIRILLQELDGLASKNLIEKNSSRITFVDDGSKDETWKILSKEIKDQKNISGIKLSRNFGHQNALLAGMLETESDVLITIDADLQDDSSVMTDMLKDYHKGIDIVAEKGSNVHASYSGKVIHLGQDDIYGKIIVLAHKNNFYTFYGHLDSIFVKKHDFVKNNEIIGLVGETGKTSGPHLHFEIWDELETKDPRLLINELKERDVTQ